MGKSPAVLHTGCYFQGWWIYFRGDMVVQRDGFRGTAGLADFKKILHRARLANDQACSWVPAKTWP